MTKYKKPKPTKRVEQILKAEELTFKKVDTELRKLGVKFKSTTQEGYTSTYKTYTINGEEAGQLVVYLVGPSWSIRHQSVKDSFKLKVKIHINCASSIYFRSSKAGLPHKKIAETLVLCAKELKSRRLDREKKRKEYEQENALCKRVLKKFPRLEQNFENPQRVEINQNGACKVVVNKLTYPEWMEVLGFLQKFNKQRTEK